MVTVTSKKVKGTKSNHTGINPVGVLSTPVRQS